MQLFLIKRLPDPDVGEGEELVERCVVEGAVQRPEVDAAPKKQLQALLRHRKHHLAARVRQLATVALQYKHGGMTSYTCIRTFSDMPEYVYFLLKT